MKKIKIVKRVIFSFLVLFTALFVYGYYFGSTIFTINEVYDTAKAEFGEVDWGNSGGRAFVIYFGSDQKDAYTIGKRGMDACYITDSGYRKSATLECYSANIILSWRCSKEDSNKALEIIKRTNLPKGFKSHSFQDKEQSSEEIILRVSKHDISSRYQIYRSLKNIHPVMSDLDEKIAKNIEGCRASY